MEMHVKNTSKKLDSKRLTYENNFITRLDDDDFDMASVEPVNIRTKEKDEVSLFQRMYKHFSRETDDLKVAEINGTEEGVAFFLHFSVHASETEHKVGEDTRILPVHYSDNYFSLVPVQMTNSEPRS